MLFRIVCAGSLLLAASACRTPEESASSAKEIPPGAQGLPIQPQGEMKLLVSLENEAAQGMYDALNAEEQIDQIGGRKTYQGDANVFCERLGSGGQIPPGAQGIVAPASYSCSIFPTTGPGFPDGAQGMPAAPVLTIDGATARAFHVAFKVQETTQGGNGRKSFQGTPLDIGCQYTDEGGTRTAYNCQVRGVAQDGGTPPPAEDPVLLSLSGIDAKTFHEKLKLQEVAKTKKRTGATWIKCEQHGFGGQIPPGAQGFAPAATFDCQIIAPASIPDGAQGFPGPGKVLAKFKQPLAATVFNQLALATVDSDDGAVKEFDAEATINCSWVKVSGKKKYTCTIKRGSGGGIPDGAQGLPIPN